VEGKTMVEIVICYAPGTAEILDVCFAALSRHDSGAPVDRIVVATDPCGVEEASMVMESYKSSLNFSMMVRDVSMCRTGSQIHGKLLDYALEECDSEYFMTLDSDCFPVAPGWLKTLLDPLINNVGHVLYGILWPWKPAPCGLDEKTMEYKVRKYHCWNSTQVACQICKTSFLSDNNLSFLGLADTGFSIVQEAWKTSGGVGGIMPSRGPLCDGMDPELNRMCSVVYGDLMYHHGGASRVLTDDIGVDGSGLSEARERVIAEKGAEWMLEDGNSHKYAFDREEEVAQFKMDGMYNAMRRYLLTHDRLFQPEWGTL
jgi:hypothetical protein